MPSTIFRIPEANQRPGHLIMVYLALILVVAPALPNGPEVMFTGASLVPVRSVDVALVREQVRIELPPTSSWSDPGHVSCRYWLHNTSSEPVAVDMAFVTGGRFERAAHLSTVIRDAGLTVTRQGEVVEVRRAALEPALWSGLMTAPPDSLPVFRVAIGAGETTEVTIDYGINWLPTPRRDDPAHVIRYHAQPAALWKGRIERAEILVSFERLSGRIMRRLHEGGPSLGTRFLPDDYTWTDEGVQWVFEDWEPDRDFEIWMDIGDGD